MSTQEIKPSKCLFDMWQQNDDVTPPTDRSGAFYVELLLNFVVEYTPVNYCMNVRTEKRRRLLQRGELLDDSKNRNTVLRITEFLPIPEFDMERIVNFVSSKAKSIESDSRNTGRDVIPILMSLRFFYSQEYNERLKKAWSLRLGTGAVLSCVPAMETVAEDLDTVTYYKGCGLIEQCAVCLVEFNEEAEITRLPCFHDFHECCIRGWLKKSHWCPLCRFPPPVSGHTEDLCPFTGRAPLLRYTGRTYRRPPRMRVHGLGGRPNLVYGRRTIAANLV